MKVLVTGGAGYIGSVISAQLLGEGHDVVVLDNLSKGHADSVEAQQGATLIDATIDDADEVLDPSFDAVVHCAARSLVAESVAQPEAYWWNNVAGSLRLLDAMRAHGVSRIVFSSTAAVYGEPAETPIREETPAVPINPYGQSKLAVDHALTGYATAHGLAAVSLRYFNVGGALFTGSSSNASSFGERHDPETHLIPNVLAVPAGRRESVDLFGTDYPTHDGTAVRDYLHVEDLGRAHLLALAWTGEDDAAGHHRVYNLGSGTGYSVAEVIKAVRDVTGHPVPVTERDRRPGDPAVLVASAERIAAELGWRAEHDLERIVADAWRFLSEAR